MQSYDLKRETMPERFQRKFSAAPLIPLGAPAPFPCVLTHAGAGLTVVSLIGALMAYRRGNQVWNQRFQRGRVFFQFGTIVALVIAGVGYNKNK